MNKKHCLKVFGLVLVSFLLFNILPSSSSPVSPNVALDDLPSQATYTIKTDGVGNYWAVASNGSIKFESANASYTIDNLIQANTTIKFMSGTFPINYLLKVDVSKIHFIGNGWGTQFTIGASGGFNISSNSLLRDIVFENIWWEGNGVAVRAITSAMAAGIRLTEFRFIHNYVHYFYGSGAIGLNLSNLENSEISYNTFYRTYTAHIQFTSNAYDSGNIRMEGNEYYVGYSHAGENVVRVQTKKKTGANGSIGAIYSWGEHYLYVTYSGYAWNITTVQGQSGEIHLSNDRLENGMLLFTKPFNGTFDINYLDVDNSQIYAGAVSDRPLINFGLYTHHSHVNDNVFSHSLSPGYIFMDNDTSSTENNAFVDNVMTGSYLAFVPSKHTFVHGNKDTSNGYFYGNYTVKTAGTDNIRNGNYLANWGATNNDIVSGTTYTVLTNDVYLTVYGGTSVNITITDYATHQLAVNVRSYNATRVGFHMKITITWGGAPTIKFLWAI